MISECQVSDAYKKYIKNKKYLLIKKRKNKKFKNLLPPL